MRKVFLVRKDATKPYTQDNWQIMQQDEFDAFKVTDAAKGRRFIRLFDYDSNGTVIFKECEADEIVTRHRELARSYRKEKFRREHNIMFVPFDFVVVDDEEVSSEELIIDENENIEEEVGKQLLKKQLYEALQQLPAEELKLVKAVYFDNEGKSARQVARDLGIPWSTMCSQMQAILKKLRKYF